MLYNASGKLRKILAVLSVLDCFSVTPAIFYSSQFSINTDVSPSTIEDTFFELKYNKMAGYQRRFLRLRISVVNDFKDKRKCLFLEKTLLVLHKISFFQNRVFVVFLSQ